jgi:hypothetical protein
MIRYLKINDRLEISCVGTPAKWKIYMDHDEVDSEGGYDEMEDAAMAAMFYYLSVK